MRKGPPGKPVLDGARDELAHNRDVLLALSRAAQAIQHARTAGDFYHVVGREIESLGGMVTLFTMNEDQSSFSLAYTSFPIGAVRRAEKLTGLSADTCQVQLAEGGTYRRILEGGRAVFIASPREVVAEALPLPLRPLADALMQVLDLRQGILAPLRLDNLSLGLMTVSSLSLTEADLPAMDSFAGQIAAGLLNVRLMQKLEEELAARRQAEQSLQHSRRLLLALSRAAQAIQKQTRTEEIYRVLGEQIKGLQCNAAILMLDSSRKWLSYTYTTISADAIRLAEKMTGLTAQGHSWPVTPYGIYNRVIVQGAGEFVPDAVHLFAETIPAPMQALTRRLMQTFGLAHGIISPLNVDEETLGVLVVFGSQNLSQDDVPAMDSFAGQLAVSLRNVRLAQKVEVELAERRQAEREARRTEEYFKALTENAADGIMVINNEGRIRYASPSASRLLGIQVMDLLDMSAFDLIHPEDLEGVAAAFMQGVGAPGYVHRGEYRFKYSDGEWRYFEITTRYLLDDPLIAGIVINGRDITQRRQAEEQLRLQSAALVRSERDYRSLFENLPIGLYRTSMFGDILDANPALVRMFGYPNRDSLLAVRARDLYVDMEAETRFQEEIGARRVLSGFEACFHRYDGSTFWAEDHVRIVCGEDGAPLYYEGSLLDVTERKQAETALRESESKFHNLVAESADGIVLTDEVGRIIEFNRAIEQVTGFERDRVVGMFVWDFQAMLVPPEMRNADLQAAARKMIEEALAQGRASFFDKTVEASFMRADGLLRHIQSRAFSVRTEMGWRLGKISRDVTDQKRIEAALIESEAELRALFSSMRDTVLVIDRDGLYRRIAATNPERFYIPPQEVVGRHLSDLFPPAQVERFIALIRHVLETGETATIEYEVPLDEQSPWFEASVSQMDADCTLWVARDVTERKRAEDGLREAGRSLELAHYELQRMFEHEQTLARTDGMTGLFNRRHFFELAVREFSASLRYKRPMTIILFDVDGFKQANDAFGHDMGDRILIQISQAAATHIRDVDVLARYGGDEFIILLPQTGAQQAFHLAERIREQVAAVSVGTENGPFAVTLSLGVAEIRHSPPDGLVEDVIRRADQALYTAKAQGNNRTVISQLR